MNYRDGVAQGKFIKKIAPVDDFLKCYKCILTHDNTSKEIVLNEFFSEWNSLRINK